jgi:hypothetical protein
MKNYNNYRYKRDEVEEDVIVVFDSETIPKENYNEEYLKQRKYHFYFNKILQKIFENFY